MLRSMLTAPPIDRSKAIIPNTCYLKQKDQHFGTEFLSYKLAVKTVPGLRRSA